MAQANVTMASAANRQGRAAAAPRTRIYPDRNDAEMDVSTTIAWFDRAWGGTRQATAASLTVRSNESKCRTNIAYIEPKAAGVLLLSPLPLGRDWGGGFGRSFSTAATPLLQLRQPARRAGFATLSL